MKKSILIICAVLAAFGLTAFGFLNENNTARDCEKATSEAIASLNADFNNLIKSPAAVELFYDIGSRYGSLVTKEDLNKAKSIYDFVPENSKRTILSYYSVSVSILDDNYNTVKKETGDNEVLTAAQIKLLQSVPYSTDILIRSEYKERNSETGKLEDSYSTPHLTVVPEKQAVCTSGKDALIAYVKENTMRFLVIIKEDDLQPGKVTFTITSEGKIAHTKLISTSGYPALDKKMVELVSSMPGTWEPATNFKGEKVDQKLVFSFGTIGC